MFLIFSVYKMRFLINCRYSSQTPLILRQMVNLNLVTVELVNHNQQVKNKDEPHPLRVSNESIDLKSVLLVKHLIATSKKFQAFLNECFWERCLKQFSSRTVWQNRKIMVENENQRQMEEFSWCELGCLGYVKGMSSLFFNLILIPRLLLMRWQHHWNQFGNKIQFKKTVRTYLLHHKWQNCSNIYSLRRVSDSIYSTTLNRNPQGGGQRLTLGIIQNKETRANYA